MLPSPARARKQSSLLSKIKTLTFVRVFILLERAHEDLNITCSVQVVDILVQVFLRYLATFSNPPGPKKYVVKSSAFLLLFLRAHEDLNLGLWFWRPEFYH